MKYTLRPFLMPPPLAPLEPLAPPAAVVPPAALLFFFVDVELQAARTPVASTTPSAALVTRRAVREPVMRFALPSGWSLLGIERLSGAVVPSWLSAAGSRLAVARDRGRDAAPHRRWAR